MREKEFISQLKEFLKRKNITFYENSFNFKGLRKDVPQLDGSYIDLYGISFSSSISDKQYDSDAIYYAYFDPKTLKLLYVIGPQFYEKA